MGTLECSGECSRVSCLGVSWTFPRHFDLYLSYQIMVNELVDLTIIEFWCPCSLVIRPKLWSRLKRFGIYECVGQLFVDTADWTIKGAVPVNLFFDHGYSSTVLAHRHQPHLKHL